MFLIKNAKVFKYQMHFPFERQTSIKNKININYNNKE